MIATGSHTDITDTNSTLYESNDSSYIIYELIYYETKIIAEPIKLIFIKGRKKIIGLILSTKNPVYTFVYVFIWPVIHIRVLSAVY